MNLLCYILTFSYVFIIIGISGLLKNKHILSQEGTRKLVHILVSGAYIIMYKTIYININIIIIPLIFVIINFVSNKKNIFKGMETTERDSYGTIYYPISMAIMAAITYFNHSFYPYYGIGLFIMAIADGVAPLLGQKISSPKIGKTNKTIIGSLTVLFLSMLVIITFNHIFNLGLSIIQITILSAYGTIVEIISSKYDNLFLPIATALLAYFI